MWVPQSLYLLIQPSRPDPLNLFKFCINAHFSIFLWRCLRDHSWLLFSVHPLLPIDLWECNPLRTFKWYHGGLHSTGMAFHGRYASASHPKPIQRHENDLTQPASLQGPHVSLWSAPLFRSYTSQFLLIHIYINYPGTLIIWQRCFVGFFLCLQYWGVESRARNRI